MRTNVHEGRDSRCAKPCVDPNQTHFSQSGCLYHAPVKTDAEARSGPAPVAKQEPKLNPMGGRPENETRSPLHLNISKSWLDANNSGDRARARARKRGWRSRRARSFATRVTQEMHAPPARPRCVACGREQERNRESETTKLSSLISLLQGKEKQTEGGGHVDCARGGGPPRDV